jgi:hypothetical protein
MISPRLRLYAIEMIIRQFSCNWATKQYNILLSNSWTTDAITLSLSSMPQLSVRLQWVYCLVIPSTPTEHKLELERNVEFKCGDTEPVRGWYKMVLWSTNSVFTFFTFQIKHSQWTLLQYYIFGNSDTTNFFSFVQKSSDLRQLLTKSMLNKEYICFAKTKHNWHSKFIVIKTNT